MSDAHHSAGAAARLQAALADRYVIERELGRGGMATVYLARDLKHDRLVALKLLDPDLGAVLGGERFLSEIRVTANLQHPHLLPLFDSGEVDGLLFYVMPYVEGETLRARLDREQQLPIDDAVRIAVAVAEALDYAHGHGVIHRDLKPENILLQHGQPMVADFGIALAVRNAGGARVTATGLSLGTPHYMSPEQATGDRVIDGRSDIYSLGAVTYEMLAGEAPHAGNNAQAIIARLMTEEPRPLGVVRRMVPDHVEAAVHCALQKLPADRFPTGKAFAEALLGRAGSGAATAAIRQARPRVTFRGRILPWLVGGAIGAALAIVALTAWNSQHQPTPATTRFTIEPPPGLSFSPGSFERPLALAPDGRMLAFVAGSRASLYLRRLDQLQSTSVAGIEAALHYDFSEDGNSLAYFSRVPPLNRIRVTGGIVSGEPVNVAGFNGRRFAWKYGSDIVYADRAGLWRVRGMGGTAALIHARDSTVDGQWTNTTVLPDGKTAAFRVLARGDVRPGAGGKLGLLPIDGGPRALVDLDIQNVIGYADGFLIYGASAGSIMGVRFDLGRRRVRGEPVRLLDNVAYTVTEGVAADLASGTLAYLTGTLATSVELVDARGARLEAVSVESRRYSDVRWSPDGQRLLLKSAPFGSADLWVYDMTTRLATRLTQTGNIQIPRWTPDGKRVAFLAVWKEGGNTAFSMPADGSAAPTPIAGVGRIGVFNFSPDGKYIVAFNAGRLNDTTAAPSVAIPLGGGPRIPLLQGLSTTSVGVPVISPDGRWMAYESTESGRREVYVRPFPTGDARLQVSQHGGDEPAWSPDGHRLFYNVNESLFAATLSAVGSNLRVARIDSLFENHNHDFSPHPDGKRFALLRAAGEGLKLVVVTNWLSEAKAKLAKR